MHEANIPSTVTEWIYHMISNRYIKLTYCEHSVTRRATKGSPQGGVLSPLLWNLTLNTFLSSLGIHSSFVQAFADDLVILIQGICKHTVRDIAQQHLLDINSWCISKGLKLSGEKVRLFFLLTRGTTFSIHLLGLKEQQFRQSTAQLTYLLRCHHRQEA